MRALSCCFKFKGNQTCLFICLTSYTIRKVIKSDSVLDIAIFIYFICEMFRDWFYLCGVVLGYCVIEFLRIQVLIVMDVFCYTKALLEDCLSNIHVLPLSFLSNCNHIITVSVARS